MGDDFRIESHVQQDEQHFCLAGGAWHWDRVHAVGKGAGMTGDVHRKSEELEGELKSGTEPTCNR